MQARNFGVYACALAIPSALGQVVETWDNGQLNGWLGNTSRTTVFADTSGGNPGGALYSSGTGMGGTWDIGAGTTASPWTGNITEYAQISFDVNLDSGDFDNLWFRVRYQDSSHNGWRYSVGADLASTDWQSFVIDFDPNWSDQEAIDAGWEQEQISASFAATMADVYSTEVRISGVGDLNARIDNFAFNVPAPGATAAIALMLCSGGKRRRM